MNSCYKEKLVNLYDQLCKEFDEDESIQQDSNIINKLVKWYDYYYRYFLSSNVPFNEKVKIMNELMPIINKVNKEQIDNELIEAWKFGYDKHNYPGDCILFLRLLFVPELCFKFRKDKTFEKYIAYSGIINGILTYNGLYQYKTVHGQGYYYSDILGKYPLFKYLKTYLDIYNGYQSLVNHEFIDFAIVHSMKTNIDIDTFAKMITYFFDNIDTINDYIELNYDDVHYIEFYQSLFNDIIDRTKNDNKVIL